MTAEQLSEAIVAKQAAAAARHSADTEFLRTVGMALEAEATRLRAAGEEPMDIPAAAAVVAALAAPKESP